MVSNDLEVNMKKILMLVILLIISFAALAQTGTVKVYQVTPDSDTSNNRYCSIASNRSGDILIIYRNNVRGMKYYFKKKGSGTDVNGEIPGDLFPRAEAYKIKWMCVRATWDGVFHAVWCNDIPYSGGTNYSMFNPVTQQWSPVEKIVNGWIEDIHLRVNPVNGDLMFGWCWYLPNPTKKIWVQFKKNGETTWGNRIAVSPNWATNTLSNFDEEGYLYTSWKQDAANIIDLIPGFGLLKKGSDGNYVYLGKVVDTEVTGWFFLTSVAAVQRKGFLVGVWEQQRGYYYIPFERQGDSILTDIKNVIRVPQADPPRRWDFSSMVIPFGEELLYTYKTPDSVIMMKRYKNGKFLEGGDIDLCNSMPNNWLYDSQEDPDIGLLTVWSTYFEPNRIFYSVWDNPLIHVRPAVNVVASKKIERSFFRIRYFTIVTWQNNPYNIEKKVNVTKFNLYRKTQGSGMDSVLLASLDPTVFSYTDEKNVDASSNFEYYVTCLDDKGNESKIESAAAAPRSITLK